MVEHTSPGTVAIRRVFMSAKQAGKMIVIFTVAFLVTSSLFVMMGDEGGQGTWPVGPVAGTLEDYSSSSTGLPSDGDY